MEWFANFSKERTQKIWPGPAYIQDRIQYCDKTCKSFAGKFLKRLEDTREIRTYSKSISQKPPSDVRLEWLQFEGPFSTFLTASSWSIRAFLVPVYSTSQGQRFLHLLSKNYDETNKKIRFQLPDFSVIREEKWNESFEIPKQYWVSLWNLLQHAPSFMSIFVWWGRYPVINSSSIWLIYRRLFVPFSITNSSWHCPHCPHCPHGGYLIKRPISPGTENI